MEGWRLLSSFKGEHAREMAEADGEIGEYLKRRLMHKRIEHCVGGDRVTARRRGRDTRCLHLLLPTVCLAVAIASGCRDRAASEPKAAGRPLEGVQLKLAVVDDAGLVESINALRGEWTAQSGAELTVEPLARDALAGAERLAADALIAPSAELGPLAERGLIVPLPQQTSFRRDKVAGWGDLFDLLRTNEVVWGDKVCAVPFGSPVFVVYCRKDLLDRLGFSPPKDWREFDRAAAALGGLAETSDSQPQNAEWSGAVLPLAPGWAGLTLIARTAPAAKGRSNYSSLFDVNTFEPLIAGPPFVEGLEEMAAAVKKNPKPSLAADPQAARRAFWQGRCGMAITWPSRAGGRDLPQQTAEGFVATIVPLPGGRRVYETSRRRWLDREPGESGRVPLLSIAGRVGMISAGSSQGEAALQLLLWLADEQRSAAVGAASSATALPHRSQIENIAAWVEPPMTEKTAKEYAKDLAAMFESSDCVSALPIPGREEYLSALDDAVRSAVSGDQPAIEALIAAAGRWRKISERLGVERQKTALRRSLGLEPFPVAGDKR